MTVLCLPLATRGRNAVVSALLLTLLDLLIVAPACYLLRARSDPRLSSRRLIAIEFWILHACRRHSDLFDRYILSGIGGGRVLGN